MLAGMMGWDACGSVCASLTELLHGILPGSYGSQPKNLGGFQKGCFRDEVNFTDDFDIYGSLALSAKLPAYTDRFTFNAANRGVDILGVHFGNIDAACLMAHFDDSNDAAKNQAKIIVPENGFLLRQEIPEVGGIRRPCSLWCQHQW